MCMEVRTITSTPNHKFIPRYKIWAIVAFFVAVFIALMCIGVIPVYAEGGEDETRTMIVPISAELDDEDEDLDAIAITVIIPPAPERQTQTQPTQETRRLFPVNVAEGYNYEGVRELVRIYELLPGENPEWINTDSFQRNGYYYQIADITRRVNVAHTTREHTEVIEIYTERNDLAAVIAGLQTTMDFVDEDGYVGMLQLNIHSIEMTQDGTRSTSRTVSQIREFPHLSNPDISLIPQTITANGRTYTLADVNWQTNTSTAIDFNSIAQTFTAIATYTRTATSTVSTGYTTQATYSGTLTRVSTGDTRFVATFIGTPILSPIVNRPTVTPSPEQAQQGQATNGGNNGMSNGNGSNGGSYNGNDSNNSINAENTVNAGTPNDTPMCETAEGRYDENGDGYNGLPTVNGLPSTSNLPTNEMEAVQQPSDNRTNDNGNSFSFLSILPFLLLPLIVGGVTVLVVMMLKFKKKADNLQSKINKESADDLSSRMASIVNQDRRELAGHGKKRSVTGDFDDDIDFENVQADEDEDADDMSWLNNELDYEETSDSKTENT